MRTGLAFAYGVFGLGLLNGYYYLLNALLAVAVKQEVLAIASVFGAILTVFYFKDEFKLGVRR